MARNKVDQITRLGILSMRDWVKARARWREEFEELDVQEVIESFEIIVHDGIIDDAASVEIPIGLAEAIALLLKSTKRERKRPRMHWRDRISEAAAIDYAKKVEKENLKKGMSEKIARDRAASKAASKVPPKLFGKETIKDRMSRKRKNSTDEAQR
jgi:hypothetical protein